MEKSTSNVDDKIYAAAGRLHFVHHITDENGNKITTVTGPLKVEFRIHDLAQLVAGARWKFPSRQIRIRHRTLSSENWASRLIKQDPSVIASVMEDDLVIDLRWIPASEDAQLAEALSAFRARQTQDVLDHPDPREQ